MRLNNSPPANDHSSGSDAVCRLEQCGCGSLHDPAD